MYDRERSVVNYRRLFRQFGFSTDEAERAAQGFADFFQRNPSALDIGAVDLYQRLLVEEPALARYLMPSDIPDAQFVEAD